MQKQSLDVALLTGGWSHEIDYSSTDIVFQSLKSLGHRPQEIKIHCLDSLLELADGRFDCAFVRTPGAYGEDGKIQGFLEMVGLPYTGSGVCSSAVGMNKDMTKSILSSIQLPSPKGIVMSDVVSYEFKDVVDMLGAPFIVKPLLSGESFGTALMSNQDQYDETIAELMAEFQHLIVEEFIEGNGSEYAVGILQIDGASTVLPICKINHQSRFYSHGIKHTAGLSTKEIPAELSASKTREIEELALLAYDTLGCHGYARFDLILKDQQPYVLEVNTVPGLSIHSLFPSMCYSAGMTYEEMIGYMLSSAFTRKPYEMSKRASIIECAVNPQ